MIAALTVAFDQIDVAGADNVLIQIIAKLGRNNFTRSGPRPRPFHRIELILISQGKVKEEKNVNYVIYEPSIENKKRDR